MSPLRHSQPRTWCPGNEVAVESAGCTSCLVVESTGCMNNQLCYHFTGLPLSFKAKAEGKKADFKGRPAL